MRLPRVWPVYHLFLRVVQALVLRSFLGLSEIRGPRVGLDRLLGRVPGLLFAPQILTDL